MKKSYLRALITLNILLAVITASLGVFGVYGVYRSAPNTIQDEKFIEKVRYSEDISWLRDYTVEADSLWVSLWGNISGALHGFSIICGGLTLGCLANIYITLKLKTSEPDR